jgi:7-cyano-7-deazaguanine reductase
MTTAPEDSPLGKASAYTDHYDPALLFPIARADKRQEIGVGAQPPFFGADLWTAYELSWLNLRGKPQVAIAHVTVPCETPHIIESKSFKLYLGSFTNTAFADVSDVQAHLRADLNEALWRGAPAMQSGVGVRVLLPEMFDREPIHEMEGLSLDRLDIECTRYTPAPDLLRAHHDEQPVTEVLTSTW